MRETLDEQRSREMATVKTYRIPQDERMNEEIICETCGRSIVNVMEIDGVPYGIDCGMKKLGLKVAKKAMKRASWHIQRLQYFLTQDDSKEIDIETEAFAIVQSLKFTDPYHRPDCKGREYGEIIAEMVGAL